MEKSHTPDNQNEQLIDLGEVDLNQNGRPKQAVVIYELTPEMIQSAKQRIEKDVDCLPQNRYKQAIQKSAKVWDNFYAHHRLNFFKDRNYLQRQIKQIGYFRQKHQKQQKIYTYLQLGCGVGNTLFPLLRSYQFFKFQGCDISAQAIKLIQLEMDNHKQFKQRLKVKVCDLVKDQIPFQNKPDLLSMIFVLSAIAPQKHQYVINKIAKWMKPGSCFFFRDYGRYDFGQVNMANKGSRKLCQNFYVKHDGVCVYYFEQKQLEKLFENAGLIKVQGSIHCRLLQNRKTGLKMYRIWVQGRFYKPPIEQFFKKLIQKETNQKQIQQKEQKKIQNQQYEIQSKQQKNDKNQKKIEQNQQKQAKNDPSKDSKQIGQRQDKQNLQNKEKQQN